MNVLSFLTFKKDIEYVYEDFTIRQVMEKANYHRYTVLPVLKRNEEYLNAIAEGDILRYIKDEASFNLKKAENTTIDKIKRNRLYQAISINADLNAVFLKALDQNFIPVVDDRNMFIGIIKRKDIIKYFYDHKAELDNTCPTSNN